MRLVEPFDLDDAARREGTQHVALLREINRQRMASSIHCTGGLIPTSLGVVGAGVMGRAIAAEAVVQGLTVTITDADESALRIASDTISRLVPESVRAGEGEMCKATRELDEVTKCDVVLEAIVEDEMKKRVLLRQLDERMPLGSLLATNTSTIPIHRLARGLRNPQRLCGTHFFLPLRERPVVELIFTDETSPEARSAAIGLTGALGRDALWSPDTVGFVVNRLMMPYVSEGMLLLTEGVAPEEIEGVAVDFGMPKGPLSLLDEIGLDTALDCGWVFSGAYEDRIAVSPLLVAMVKAGRLGQKSGEGFFRYTTNEAGELRQETDPAAAALVARWAGRKTEPSAEEIAARLFLPMVFEGTRILADHGSGQAADIDLGAVLGLGMAPGRGGPLFWCDRIGAGRIVEIAAPLKTLGVRMEPPAELRQMADVGASYHGRGSRTEATSA